jgi:hypothetical protein
MTVTRLGLFVGTLYSIWRHTKRIRCIFAVRRHWEEESVVHKSHVISSNIPEWVTATVESKNIARPFRNLHISVLYDPVLYDQSTL